MHWYWDWGGIIVYSGLGSWGAGVHGLKYRVISLIYCVSVSIDTIYSIDNRLTKILIKNRKYRLYIGLGAIYCR